MRTKRLATTATMVAAGLLIGTAASGQTDREATTPDLAAFMARYDCAILHDNHEWTDGTPMLTKPRGVKTTLYVLPGEKTVMVRKGTNKATAVAIATYANLRMVCSKRVPWSEKPELGS